MGTWGAGNFDRDAAMDWVDELVDQNLTAIREAMAEPSNLEPDEWDGTVVPCRLETLCVLDEAGVPVSWPDTTEIEAWKVTFLGVWEATIDDLGPTDEYRTERRVVLEATFDRAIRAAGE